MEIHASIRHLHIAPRKVRLVASMVKGMDTARAAVLLGQMSRRPATPLLKLLSSVLANAAHNFHIASEQFYIKDIRVDSGPVGKRFRARAFGRAAPIKKRTSHVSIVLDTRDGAVSVRPALTRVREPMVRDARAEDSAGDFSPKPRRASAGSGESRVSPRPGASRFVPKIFQRKVI